MRNHVPVHPWAVLPLALAACRDPTQISLEITTDFGCSEGFQTSIAAATFEGLESAEAVTVTSSCLDGRIGSIVATPSGDDDGPIGFRVVTSTDGAACSPPDYGPSCIVARRALHYLPHTPLLLPITMRDNCAGLPCGPLQTCVAGVCRSAEIFAELCASSGGCGEDMLPPPPPLPGWVQVLGASGVAAAQALAVDATGRACITGWFDGTLSQAGNLTSLGGRDVFVACYTPAGALDWAHRYGSVGDDQGNGIALDPGGNVYVTGHFGAPADFGGDQLVPSGGTTLFVASYDGSSGKHLWSNGYGEDSDGHAVKVANGSLHVTGNFRLSINFGGGNLGGDDNVTFVARLALADGSHEESFRVAATNAGFDFAVDPDGDVFLTGVQGRAGVDAFVARFSPIGEERWGLNFSSAGDDEGLALLLSPAETALYVTGRSGGSFDIAGVQKSGGGASDLFLVRLDSETGGHVWSHVFAATAADAVAAGDALALDPAGNLQLTGFYSGGVDFGKGPIAATTTEDLFLARFDPDGVHLGSMTWTSPGVERAHGLAALADGSLLLAGELGGSVDFDVGATFPPPPSSDAFLVRLPP